MAGTPALCVPETPETESPLLQPQRKKAKRVSRILDDDDLDSPRNKGPDPGDDVVVIEEVEAVETEEEEEERETKEERIERRAKERAEREAREAEKKEQEDLPIRVRVKVRVRPKIKNNKKISRVPRAV